MNLCQLNFVVCLRRLIRDKGSFLLANRGMYSLLKSNRTYILLQWLHRRRFFWDWLKISPSFRLGGDSLLDRFPRKGIFFWAEGTFVRWQFHAGEFKTLKYNFDVLRYLCEQLCRYHCRTTCICRFPLQRQDTKEQNLIESKYLFKSSANLLMQRF